jgi:hypothetical protein
MHKTSILRPKSAFPAVNRQVIVPFFAMPVTNDGSWASSQRVGDLSAYLRSGTDFRSTIFAIS